MSTHVSDFMLQLATKLGEKGLSESSVMQYLRCLKTLNGGKAFKNLYFLRDKESIAKILSEYSPNTQTNMITAVVSSLSVLKDNHHMKALHKTWSAELDAKKAEIKDEIETNGGTSRKTEKQEANWIDWDDVIKRREELRDSIDKFVNNRLITEKQYNEILGFIVLALYTYVPPRRNADYSTMVIVKKYDSSMPNDRNYFDLDKKRFIFNVFKTAKKYGQQILDISKNDGLLDAIEMYLRVHPTFSSRATETPFLVYNDGSSLSAVNAITRILNKIFDGKNVGASMLRHSYLSGKYDVEEMEEDAKAMAHSTSMQRDYLKA